MLLPPGSCHFGGFGVSCGCDPAFAMVVAQSVGVAYPQTPSGGCFGRVAEPPQFRQGRYRHILVAGRSSEQATGGDRPLLRVVAYQHQPCPHSRSPAAQRSHLPGSQLACFVDYHPRAGRYPPRLHNNFGDRVSSHPEAGTQLCGCDSGWSNSHHPAVSDSCCEAGEHSCLTSTGGTDHNSSPTARTEQRFHRCDLIVAEPANVGVRRLRWCYVTLKPRQCCCFGGDQTRRMPQSVVEQHLGADLRTEIVEHRINRRPSVTRFRVRH